MVPSHFSCDTLKPAVILLLCTAVPVTADVPTADRPTSQIRTSGRRSAQICLLCWVRLSNVQEQQFMTESLVFANETLAATRLWY